MTRGIRPALVVILALAAGCGSGGSGYSGSTRHSFYYGGAWYDDPYYWYDNPDYIVVEPPARPGDGEGRLRPSHPIANAPDGPVQHPSSGSRMPAAQPRMSQPMSRPSIPRGGGGRRR